MLDWGKPLSATFSKSMNVGIMDDSSGQSSEFGGPKGLSTTRHVGAQGVDAVDNVWAIQSKVCVDAVDYPLPTLYRL